MLTLVKLITHADEDNDADVDANCIVGLRRAIKLFFLFTKTF